MLISDGLLWLKVIRPLQQSTEQNGGLCKCEICRLMQVIDLFPPPLCTRYCSCWYPFIENIISSLQIIQDAAACLVHTQCSSRDSPIQITSLDYSWLGAKRVQRYIIYVCIVMSLQLLRYNHARGVRSSYFLVLAPRSWNAWLWTTECLYTVLTRCLG